MVGCGQGCGARGNAVGPCGGGGSASLSGDTLTTFTDIAAGTGEGLGLFDGTVGEAAVSDASSLLVTGVGGVPDTGLTLVEVSAAVVIGTGAVAVSGALDTISPVWAICL